MADATQTGASTDEVIDTENLKVDESNPPPRLRAMESIKVVREDDDEPQANRGDQQLAAQLESDSKTAPESEPGPKALTDGLDKMLVTVKIDGVERQVTVEEMQRTYQKAGAADKRLEEATRLLREAQAREQQAPPVGVAPTGAPADSANVPEGGGDEGKEFLAALFEGDESKAAAAFKKAIGGRPQQPTPTEAQMVAQLTPAIKQQLLQESALEKFEKDYGDIVSDPYLDQVAAEFIRAEMDGGKSFIEALEIGGTKTRDWIASKAPKTDPVPKPTMNRDAKLERKASIDQIPALNKAASTTVEQPQSASDVIAAMRKARGLD
jgi:hypothetical protein